MRKWRRARWLFWRNSTTGEVVATDLYKRRVNHMRRRVFAICDAVRERYKDYSLEMLTLTYARPGEWSAGHLSEATATLRRYYGRALVAAVAVAEIQAKRFARTGDAVVHYHVLLILHNPVGMRLPIIPRDVRGDYSWLWVHGFSHLTSAEGPGYLTGYVSKNAKVSPVDYDNFPKGLRTFSVSIGGDDDLKRAYETLYDVYSYRAATLGEIVSDLVALGAEMDVYPEALRPVDVWRFEGARRAPPWWISSDVVGADL